MSRLIPLLTGVLLSLLALSQPLQAEDQVAAAPGGYQPLQPIAVVEPAEVAPPADLVPVRRGSSLLSNLASKLAAEKAAKEKASAERAAEKAVADKAAAQKAALIKAATEKASADRAAQRLAAKAAEEKAEELKIAAQKAAAEKAAAEKSAKRAADKLAEEKADAERAARKAAEKAAAEKALAEKRSAEKAAEEKKAADKLAAEEKKAADKLAAEKAAAEKLAMEEKKAAAEKAQAEQKSLAAKLAAEKASAENVVVVAQAAAPKPEPVIAQPAPAPAPAPVAVEPAAPVQPVRPMPASWQARYELGPGDVLNFGIHGKPTLKRLNVPVAPDGTISYLQARQVDVRGKTIDELRVELNEILEPYQGESRVIIAPARLGSKRYTLLGEVRTNGTYPLDRPTTLLQAIAQSGGINLGVSGEDAVELADLRRSFVVRHGNRVPVDMESLYLHGDMTQNVHLEPGDYIYVASKIRNEIYVFGAVNQPGVKSIDSSMSTIGAISAANGFNQVAWRDKVLVIRGRLDQPQTFVVELNKVLHGKAQDFELEPGDIVYAHTRPWAFAEKLLDVAIKSFIDGSISGSLADSGVAVSANGAAF